MVKPLGIVSLFLCISFLSSVSLAKHELAPNNLPISSKEFFKARSIEDQNGKVYRFANWKNYQAVVLFTHGIGCPIVRHIANDFGEIANQYKNNIAFFMINTNLQDNAQTVSRDADQFSIQIPILIDDTQAVAKHLGITRTAETLVINPKTWEVLYRGPVNDRVNYETVKQHAQHHYLVDTLTQVIANKTVKRTDIEFVGCAVSYF